MLNSLPNEDDAANPFGPPPFNLEAEQALLGAMLLRNEIVEDIGRLQRHHFFDPLHAALFDSILTITKSGRKATTVELIKLFEKSPPIDANTTVAEYIFRLVREVPSLNAAREYARLVLSTGIRRNLILIGEDIIASARETSLDYEPHDLIEEAEERLFSLAEMAQPETAQIFDFGQAASTAYQEFKDAKEKKRTSLSTGLKDLDSKIGGMHPGNLIVLGGRPSMGKTALATSIAYRVAKSGGHVDFFSLEMTATELANRVIGAEARVPSSDIRIGDVSSYLSQNVEKAVGALQALAMTIDQTGGISIATLASRARRNKRRKNTKLIVVDYLQLMQAKRRAAGNRVEDVSEITNGLKAVAKDLNVPVLALSQLSRNVEHRDNKRPQLSDLRESGSIEQDADIVMFVYRDEYYLEREKPSEEKKVNDWRAKLAASQNKAEIIVAKQRHGEVGTVEAVFNPALCLFSDLARREVPNDRA